MWSLMSSCWTGTSSSVAPSRSSCSDLREHPLKNYLIVQKVFQYCPNTFDSVKKRRLVCKVWKEASESEWKLFSATLKIIQNDNSKLGTNKLEGTTTTTLANFLESRSKIGNSKLSTRNFVLDRWKVASSHFDPAYDSDLNLYQRFWKLCSQNISLLTLSGCTFPLHENLFHRSFLDALPNLEKLCLLNCKITSSGFLDEFIIDRASRVGEIILQERERASVRLPLFVRDEATVPLDKSVVDGLPCHARLKYLQVENVTFKKSPAQIPWSVLIIIFPKLERISAKNQPENIDTLFKAIRGSPYINNLKYLDVMEISHTADKVCSDNVLNCCWREMCLNVLTLDLGFQTDRKDVRNILKPQAKSLKELHLFRAPFAAPYSAFLCESVMPNLSELYLWGAVCENLDFLVLMPHLRILKWNAICYEKGRYGAHVQDHLNRKDVITFSTGDVVERTGKLGGTFKLENMTTLELECGPIFSESWRKLGRWMPNLRSLKGRILGDENLALVGKLWQEMENLELAHGSRVSANGIEKVLSTKKWLQNLCSFTWKPCPCIDKTVNSKLHQQEKDAEIQLRSITGGNVTLPWNRTNQERWMKPTYKNCCREDLFEKAVVNGGTHIFAFLQALTETK